MSVPAIADPGAPLSPWAAFALAYLAGSIPFGLLLARARGVDLRSIGSGNIGATNATRALGRAGGVAVFLLDFGKGLVPVLALPPLVAWGASPRTVAVSVGAAAVLGHCFPPWLRFRGGKGVSTCAGAVMGVDPALVAVGVLAWLAVALSTRYAGLASLALVGAFPLAALWLHRADRGLALGMTGIFLLIVVRHRSNIARMLAGTEPRMRAFRRREAVDG